MSGNGNELEELYREIGRVSLAWNDIHVALFHVFTHVASLQQEKAGLIFKHMTNDSTQRRLIGDMASLYFVRDPEFGKRFRELLRRVDKLAADRNTAMHTAYAVDLYTDETLMDTKVEVVAVQPFERNKNPRPTGVNHYRQTSETLNEVAIDLFRFHHELLERPDPPPP